MALAKKLAVVAPLFFNNLVRTVSVPPLKLLVKMFRLLILIYPEFRAVRDIQSIEYFEIAEKIRIDDIL